MCFYCSIYTLTKYMLTMRNFAFSENVKKPISIGQNYIKAFAMHRHPYKASTSKLTLDVKESMHKLPWTICLQTLLFRHAQERLSRFTATDLFLDGTFFCRCSI